ncbi:MAG: hypothetical protein QOF04_2757 [Solirubrobacteraceae bacterium]|nr:hypothetical protein [Solirubrobacteraceae bacterium]
MQLALRNGVTPHPGAVRSRGRAAPVAAALSLAAAWVHLSYTSSHLRQWWAYGAFFLAVGAGQELFAAAVLRWPAPRLAVAGIAGNVAVVAMYVLSRTAGVPVGPHANVPEAAGPIDMATTATEVVLVGVLLWMLGRSAQRHVLDGLMLFGGFLWALRLTGHLP